MRNLILILLICIAILSKAQEQIGTDTYMYSYPVETKTVANKNILVWFVDYDEDIPSRKSILKKLKFSKFDVIDFRDLFPFHLSFNDIQVDSILKLNKITSIVHLQYADVGTVEKSSSTTTYGSIPGTNIPQSQTTGGTYTETVSVKAKLTLYSIDNMDTPICYVTSSSYVGTGGRTYNMFVRACKRMFLGLKKAKIIK